jgi:hypothetical protein
LKSLEQRANEQAERKSEESCACAYVEVTEGEEPTEEAARVVASNLLCFARHPLSRRHVGINTVIVSRSETNDDEDDDAPLVA